MSAVLPDVAALELTYRCNHKCRFCSCPWYAGMLKPGPEMDAAEWRQLICEFADQGVRQFAITGGETLLKDGVFDILDCAANVGSVNLLSNGRILDEKTIDFCAKRGIHLSISLPGLTTFNANTDSDTEVTKVLSHFQYAKSVGCTTTVGIAVTKLNLPELYETIAAAFLAGATNLLLNRFLPGGRGLKHPELLLTAEEVVKVADIAEAVLAKADRSGHFGTEMPECVIDASKYRHLQVSTGCSAASGFFVVGPNGMIRTCNHSPVEIVRWNEWRKLPDELEWMHMVRHDRLPAMCAGCDKAAHCAGGCREAARVFRGSPLAPDPVCETVKPK